MATDSIPVLVRDAVVEILQFPMDGSFNGEKFDALVKKVEIGSIYMRGEKT